MSEEQINKIKLFLQDEVQLGSVEHFENEDGDLVFLSNECLVTLKNNDTDIILDLDISLYPDIVALVSLGINDLANDLNKNLYVGEVFSFDENYDIHFGEEAIKMIHSQMDQEVENTVQMDHILMMSDECYEC